MFKTRKVDHPLSKRSLYGDIEKHRNAIMTEVLVNLNSIVKLLRSFRGEEPQCVSRIADWEAFGRKICRGIWGATFTGIMETMNTEKGRFSLEDDYLYMVLKHIVIDNEQAIEDEAAIELYSRLKDQAEQIKLRDFDKRYKSPGSIGKRLANIKDELNEVMVFKVRVGSGNKRLYSFLPQRQESEAAEADMAKPT